MTGSNEQSKTSTMTINQLPLKGFHAKWVHPETKREFTIEGMGDGRFRIHAGKGRPRPK